MGTKTLTTMRADIKIDLNDGATLWSTSELDRCVQRAVADLSRYLPRERIYEVTVSTAVEDEASTAPAVGTYLALTYKPIKYQSETVTDATGATTYTRDTDYTMDYSNGEYTIISTGSITESDDLLFTYTKSKISIDLSSKTDLIRVTKVEYPIGQTPQSIASYETYGNILTITSLPGESQTNLSENKHIAIHYQGEHTAPTVSAAGTNPSFLDWTIEHAAAGYCMLVRAADYEHQAATDAGLATTALSSIAAIHTLAAAALAKVITYIETNAGGTAKAVLEAITTGAANLRTAVNTALDAANAYLDEVDTTDLQGAEAVWASEADYVTGTSAPASKHYLTTGDDKINLVNVGSNVPENYAEYARQSLELAKHFAQTRMDFISQANARTNAAIGYIQEAAQRLSNLSTHIEEANGWVGVAMSFVQEASQRIAQIDRYISTADRYQGSANQFMALSDRFRQEGLERRNEVYAIWKDPKQYIGDLSSSSRRQIAT